MHLLAPLQLHPVGTLCLIKLPHALQRRPLFNDGMGIGSLESKGADPTSQASTATAAAMAAACCKHACLLPGHLELSCHCGRLESRSHMRVHVTQVQDWQLHVVMQGQVSLC